MAVRLRPEVQKMEPSESPPEQLLTFELADEVFALEISRVREVLEFAPLTRVPRTPEFLRGVMNLRGSILPVVDLRRMFDMGSTEATVDACIIIVEFAMDGEERVIGVLADAVKEVLGLPRAEIAAPPQFGTRIAHTFLRGMGRHGDRLLMILSIDDVFSSAERGVVRAASTGRPNPAAEGAEDESRL